MQTPTTNGRNMEAVRPRISSPRRGDEMRRFQNDPWFGGLDEATYAVSDWIRELRARKRDIDAAEPHLEAEDELLRQNAKLDEELVEREAHERRLLREEIERREIEVAQREAAVAVAEEIARKEKKALKQEASLLSSERHTIEKRVPIFAGRKAELDSDTMIWHALVKSMSARCELIRREARKRQERHADRRQKLQETTDAVDRLQKRKRAFEEALESTRTKTRALEAEERGAEIRLHSREERLKMKKIWHDLEIGQKNDKLAKREDELRAAAQT